MIPARELRIGNLVYRDKRDEPVPMTLPYFSNLYRLDPVLITEEWLLKFGFEKRYDRIGYKEYILGDYSVTVYNGKMLFVICNYMEIPPLVKIQYVH